MVVQGSLDFNLLLGRDYVYTMKAVVSTLFRVMHFPHDEKIVTIDQLSFVKLDHCMTPCHIPIPQTSEEDATNTKHTGNQP